MRFLVILALLPSLAYPFVPLTSNDKPSGHIRARDYAKNLRKEGLPALARITDQALDAALRVAVVEMRAKGDMYWADADEIEWTWKNKYKGYLVRMVAEDRDIGDHPPISQWLALAYAVIEASLGTEVCKALHLSDIKTINYGIPVVFRPKSFPMGTVAGARIDEYRRHFNRGAVYYGVVPVAVWWGISIGCWTGTAGIASFLCSIAATAGEWLMAHTLGPKLSDFVYHLAGGE